ncbi:hypothetical protein [Bacillus toyonensis]|uniref:hypothetical protein n=1 Tax=Bacillus toyonensis TaxID=155322 RepID=UPI001593E66A|nr:hypothetical protein [Bacillus toyonensis]WIG24911.1 hypothetical protein QPL81_00605 [Bacillus toyonensis]
MMQMEIVHRMESTNIHGMKMIRLYLSQNKVKRHHLRNINMTMMVAVLKKK